MPTLVKNKKVRFNYTVLEEIEAGIVLLGAEVKSIKNKQAKLDGAYVGYENGELWLKNAYISPYQLKNQPDYEPERHRKLLIKRDEIDRLQGKMKAEGLTLVPESLYTTRGLIKVTLALVRGKKRHDKRAALKKRDTDRSIARAMKRQV